MLRNTSVPLAVLLAAAASAPVLGAETTVPGPRVPVAMTWGPDHRLHAALRDGRCVVVVDPGSWKVIATWDVGIRPADLAIADDRSTLLVGGMAGEFQTVDRAGRIGVNVVAGRGP